MQSISRFLRWRRAMPPWDDAAPVREEIFGIERLEQHAESLAAAQPVTDKPPRVLSLQVRLDQNAAALLAAYRASARDLESEHGVVPAAEWLLDNYHLVEEQIREIRDDLPPGYYRQLPKLAAGPFAGYPRVFGAMWAFVAHTDSYFDAENLRRFVAAYQRVQPLSTGELWAVAITLRIVLIENLRRLADQILIGSDARADADAFANRLLEAGRAQSALDEDIATRSPDPLSERFAAQLAKRLRDQDPRTTPALGWLDERLARQGTSIDDVVQHSQQRQGASNLSVRNVITSMRLISDIDWAELFESMSLVDARLRAGSAFATMDFPTRNLYRNAIEQLVRGSNATELEIADHALAAARAAAASAATPAEAERVGDPGYHLIAEGRPALERTIGFRAPPRLRFSRFNLGLGIVGYVAVILVVATVLLLLALGALRDPHVPRSLLALFCVLAALPATEVATALVNRAITWSFGATALPGLALPNGIPAALRTLVVVPTLLGDEADLLAQIEQLEVHHLSGASGDLAFALLTDGVDADRETLEDDARLLAAGSAAIATLNERHGPGPAGDRFFLLHRRRTFNSAENRWMGWERKRGKLHELNRLLRGAPDTNYIALAGQPLRVPDDVRYVITLDADTRLPRDAALRLVGKMAHPLNRPRFDASEQRVVGGYAILQPRVTPSLPVGCEGSLFQRVFSSPGGMDPYAAAVSDVYQDLFGEGSYTGKGIYDVDAFEAALQGRVPENALLSHDLFEGVFARAGLASDVELVEEFPSRYDVAAKRQHRWTRGDWQLLSWILAPRRSRKGLPPIARGKMFDNLRRSLIAPSTVGALGVCWLLPMPAALLATVLVIATITIPAFLPIVFSLVPHRGGIALRTHLDMLWADLKLAIAQSFLSIAFLADEAWRMLDAIARTLTRLVTRRRLLEWTTTAQSSGRPQPGLHGFFRQMVGGLALTVVVCAVALALAPASWPLVLPFAALWLAAPALAQWASESPDTPGGLRVDERDALSLRLVARRTWRYFEAFVTPRENMLPPDNFQETPERVVAARTSPTNIGMYLLAAVAARDFGWASTTAVVERLEATFVTLDKLERCKGHFFNWYDTRDLRVLTPAYVSSVDSGNLAGHLVAVANACEEWIDAPLAADARPGLIDTLWLAREAVALLPAAAAPRGIELAGMLAQIDGSLRGSLPLEALAPTLKRQIEKTIQAAEGFASSDDDAADVVFWLEALRRSVAEHAYERMQFTATPQLLNARLQVLADQARAFAMAMDFAFLLDPERKLLSIGFAFAENRLDPSCYDLLASEARLASLFAIAKGDAPTRHWFRLGRAATPLEGGSALISWSGSMFEYLMPSLVMRAPAGSLLEQTNRRVVARQQAHAATLGIPWGISESAYNARDMEFTYQYSNFGVPGLGLKRGLSENAVIAPYATGLATMVDPHAAQRNFLRLTALGARGRFGFYEALDFTPSRLPDDTRVAIVRSFMAHHQGMTIVAIANTLYDGRMRERFHREPMIRASELLLQERMPRNVAVAHPRAEEVRIAATDAGLHAPLVRRVTSVAGAAPITHLLSNGSYAVMLTAAGSGYSRWRDIAVTRWREDATRDNWGSHIFLRDTQGDAVWSAAGLPTATGDAHASAVEFGEDHAEFVRHEDNLTTTLEILVSGEADAEVRRVSLLNTSRRTRTVELTSYAEIVLTTAAADNAHPAFAKMFVQTEHLAEFDALLATRRTRSNDEAEVWAAHFAVVEGESVGEVQFESDRARFIGRGRTLDNAAALSERTPLSNTVGSVLDAVFSLRHRVRIEAGGVARVAFWTVVASSRAELLDLLDKHHDRSAFDRAKTLAWTQAQVQLRHLDIDTAEAADFQRLAAPLLYADARFRAAAATIERGAGAQSGLWPYSVSGDLPIVLLRIDDVEDIALVRQFLRAHEYWNLKRLAVDLVIINERASSYVQDLQIAIETAVRSSQSRLRFGTEFAYGAVHALRADLMTVEARALLHSVARIVSSARHGPIAAQIAAMRPARLWPAPAMRARAPRPAPPAMPIPDNLEFFNGTGGFGRDGREYVTLLHDRTTTPAPWINVISNADFGFQVSADGSGYAWAGNSRENQLTAWSNDPVSDPPGDTIYVRDEESLELFGVTAQPIRDRGTYVARHGHGYSRFEHTADGIALELLQFVALTDPVRVSRLTLRNDSGVRRRLSITSYAEWVLGTSRGASAPFIVTTIDDCGALFARNPWSTAFPGRIAFADLGGKQTAWTADRTEFLGRGGMPSSPAALGTRKPLSGATGAGLDPCSALQCMVELEPGESIDVVGLLGQCTSADAARALVLDWRQRDPEAELAKVEQYWSGVLGAIRVKTPDRSMDIMLNGWLLYQALACRIRARSAFYQASGAYGFRDQLQDGMALTFAQPAETRQHLLRAAARQFVEGDVQHWWLPHSGQGVRTSISDDRVWLAYATATYIITSGDTAVLDENVPFLEGPLLRPDEHDAFFAPMPADASASLFEHCARGLDQAIELTGALGLPLIGSGDWNDGMNRVGAEGHGESVWLAWLLIRSIELFEPHARTRDPARARRWNAHAVRVRASVERVAWDGEWYRRATYDDGTWLGSSASEECRIDSIAQSWAVLSGAADPARAAKAMASLEHHLILRDEGLALLFTPPFDRTPRDPGYIKGYPPGLRENGGQYSHAAMWAVLAFAKLGQGDKASALFAMLNPINHARTPPDAERYKVEPYVVAADIYSVAPHAGRGGWTWYTGAAGWMHRAGVEGILGIRREGAELVIDPCMPSTWPQFEAELDVAGTRYTILVENPSQRGRGITSAMLDDRPIAASDGAIRLPLDSGTHRARLSI